MTPNSIFLSQSSFVGSSLATTVAQEWQGGRTALAITATAYASGALYIQGLGPDNKTWINVGGPYGINQYTSLDLPRGQYKMVNTQSTSIGVFAYLATVKY